METLAAALACLLDSIDPHNPEDCETYIKAHVHEVYGYWHTAVGELIRELAADRKRTIARELG